MAQFDLFSNPIHAARAAYPYVVVMQSDTASGDADHIVAPLVERAKMGPVAGRLLPTVSIDGLDHLVVIPALTGMPRRALAQPLRTLEAHRAELLAAIDLLFFGI